MYNGISCYLYSHEKQWQSLKDTEGRNIKAAAITLRIAAAGSTASERILYKSALLFGFIPQPSIFQGSLFYTLTFLPLPMQDLGLFSNKKLPF